MASSKSDALHDDGKQTAQFIWENRGVLCPHYNDEKIY